MGRLVVIAVAVLLLIVEGAWCTCHHGAAPPPIPGWYADDDLYSLPYSKQNSSQHRRTMHAQAAWTQLKLSFDMSQLDAAKLNPITTCVKVGDFIPLGIDDSSYKSPKCQPPFLTTTCFYECTENDVVGSALVDRLRPVLNQAAKRVESFFEVEERTKLFEFDNRTCGNEIYAGQLPPSVGSMVVITAQPSIELPTLGESCYTDPATGRPLVGRLNVAPAFIGQQFLTDDIVHQMFHLLGFETRLAPTFRYPGTTQTYNQKDPVLYKLGPLRGDGIVPGLTPGSFKYVVNDTGIAGTINFIGPNVIAKASRYYNCFSIKDTGIPLESSVFKPGVPLANHWEKTVAFFDIMSGIINASAAGLSDADYLIPNQGAISPLTLGFMEDTGWYKLLKEEEPSTYLKNVGCDYASCSNSHVCSTEVTGNRCLYNNHSLGVCISSAAFPTANCPITVQTRTLNTCEDFRGRAGRPTTGPHAMCYTSQIQITGISATPGPGCYTTVCVGQGTAEQYIQVEKYFYKCDLSPGQDTINLVTQKMKEQNLDAGGGPGPLYIGPPDVFGYVNYFDACNSAFGGPIPHRTNTWPQIESITPTSASMVNVPTVTVTGKDLDGCTHVSLNGEFPSEPGAIVEGKLVTKLTKPLKEGKFDVLLVCNRSDIPCSQCIFGRLSQAFTFANDLSNIASDAEKFFNDLTNTPEGIGGLSGTLVGIVLFIIVVKFVVLRQPQQDREEGWDYYDPSSPARFKDNPRAQEVEHNNPFHDL